MWTRKLLKDNAKIAFRRNYWTCVAVSFVCGIFIDEFGINNVVLGGILFTVWWRK